MTKLLALAIMLVIQLVMSTGMTDEQKKAFMDKISTGCKNSMMAMKVSSVDVSSYLSCESYHRAGALIMDWLR